VADSIFALVDGHASRVDVIVMDRHPEGGSPTMDLETRNEFEHSCALAEIEQDADKFVEIKRSIIRLLDENESRLNRKPACHRPAERWIHRRFGFDRKVSLLRRSAH
jgi:hypothetical protein